MKTPDAHADRRDAQRAKRRYGPTTANPGYRKIIRGAADAAQVAAKQASKDRADFWAAVA